MNQLLFWLMITILPSIVVVTSFLLVRQRRTQSTPLVIILPVVGLVIFGVYVVWYYSNDAG